MLSHVVCRNLRNDWKWYMYRNRIHFIVNVLALAFFTLRCSQTTIFGGRPFSLIYIIFLIREESVNLGFSFWNKKQHNWISIAKCHILTVKCIYLSNYVNPLSFCTYITSFSLYAPKCTGLLISQFLPIHLTIYLLLCVKPGYWLNK